MRTYIIQFSHRCGSFLEDEHSTILARITSAKKIIVLNCNDSSEYSKKLSGLTNSLFVIESTYLDKVKIIHDLLNNNGNVFIKSNLNLIDFFNDKFKGFEYLKNHGFKQQHTIRYSEKHLEFPFVLKGNFGNQGSEVWLINNKNEIASIIDSNKHDNLIMQEYYGDSFGVDHRVIITQESEYYYKRIGADGSFKSNIDCGGERVFTENLPNFIKKNIKKLKKIIYADFPELKNDYFAIDLFESNNDFNIIEFNYNPGLSADLLERFPNLINDFRKNCFSIPESNSVIPCGEKD